MRRRLPLLGLLALVLVWPLQAARAACPGVPPIADAVPGFGLAVRGVGAAKLPVERGKFSGARID